MGRRFTQKKNTPNGRKGKVVILSFLVLVNYYEQGLLIVSVHSSPGRRFTQTKKKKGPERREQPLPILSSSFRTVFQLRSAVPIHTGLLARDFFYFSEVHTYVCQNVCMRFCSVYVFAGFTAQRCLSFAKNSVRKKILCLSFGSEENQKSVFILFSS